VSPVGEIHRDTRGPFFREVLLDPDVFLHHYPSHHPPDVLRPYVFFRKLIASRSAVHRRHGRAKRHGELGFDNRLRIVFLPAWLRNQRPTGFENCDLDAEDRIRFEVVLSHQGENPVDRPLHIAEAGVRLDGRAHDLERFAKILRDQFEYWSFGVAVQESVAAFQNRGGSAKAFGGQHRSLNAVLRRETRMQPLGPSALCQEFH